MHPPTLCDSCALADTTVFNRDDFLSEQTRNGQSPRYPRCSSFPLPSYRFLYTLELEFCERKNSRFLWIVQNRGNLINPRRESIEHLESRYSRNFFFNFPSLDPVSNVSFGRLDRDESPNEKKTRWSRFFFASSLGVFAPMFRKSGPLASSRDILRRIVVAFGIDFRLMHVYR